MSRTELPAPVASGLEAELAEWNRVSDEALEEFEQRL